MSKPASADACMRRGLVSDAEQLATFAASTFLEAFGDGTDADDMRAHLAATYRPDLQARELADPNIITWLALRDARIVAYAQVRRAAAAPACVIVPDAVEVQRFYADRCERGTGLALHLMEHAFEAARELGGRHAWLGVWERNARAMAFYRKAGFVEIGSTYYTVGSERQTDRVFLTSLSPRNPPAAHTSTPFRKESA